MSWCLWKCRLCFSGGGVARDPVAAIREHLDRAHGEVTPTANSAQTSTRVSTDVRDSIWRGVR
jgi:hypothetical protein